MERFKAEFDAVLARIGNQGSDSVRDHLSRFRQANFRATAHHQHQRIGMERGGLIDCAVVIFEIFFPAGGGRAGEHASAADARDVQARILYVANAGGETGLFDLVPPEGDRRDAVAYASPRPPG